MRTLLKGCLVVACLFWHEAVSGHESRHDLRLPVIGPAPNFTLLTQDDRNLTLSDLRGKAVAVTFIFASCTDTCPMLTDKMARVQDELGDKFGRMISFVSITVDPERDTPKILRNYAKAFGADPIGWYFLTGTVDEVRNVERSFGVYAAKAPDETVDHTFLTSLIDTEGNLRVQYLGYRFDQEEFKRDLLSLVDESR